MRKKIASPQHPAPLLRTMARRIIFDHIFFKVVLRLPRVDRVGTHSDLPSYLCCAPPRFHLLQGANHLRFRMPTLRHNFFPSFVRNKIYFARSEGSTSLDEGLAAETYMMC